MKISATRSLVRLIPNPFGATYPFVLDSYSKGKFWETLPRLDIL